MDYMAEFAQRLRAQREKQGLTQAQLAGKVGVTSQTISAYEKNCAGEKGKTPTLDKAVSLARVLGVSLDYLCGSSQDIEGISFENLADVVSFLTVITKYFDCSVRSGTINLNEEEAYSETDERGEEVYIATAEVAMLTIKNSMLANFFGKRNKMYRLYSDGTIEEDMYNSWLRGETEKLEKWIVQKKCCGIEDFEADDG